MSTHRSLLILLACALGMGVAACGSSNSGSGSASTSAPAASSPAPSGAAKQITANWTTFFDAKTPTPQRIKLLQDGEQFASVIKSQAGSGLAASASAKVTKVVVTSPTQATVTYSILVGGQPALTGKTGTAVKQDGTWKVGVSSFCGLLALENGGKTAGLPSACKSAS